MTTHSLFHFVPTGKPSSFWYFATTAAPVLPDGPAAFPVLRSSPDESVHEHGWGLPCTARQARAIGRRANLAHLYEFTAENVIAHPLPEGNPSVLGTSAACIRDPRSLRHFGVWIQPSGHPLDPLELAGICTRAGAHFPHFDFTESHHAASTHFTHTVTLHVATRHPAAVLTLAHDLRHFLPHASIAITHRGAFLPVTEYSIDAILLDAIDHSPP